MQGFAAFPVPWTTYVNAVGTNSVRYECCHFPAAILLKSIVIAGNLFHSKLHGKSYIQNHYTKQTNHSLYPHKPYAGLSGYPALIQNP